MSELSDKTLFLSDDFVFYTLEGEGKYIGWPSVFMRMSMCNLTCIGFKSEDAPFGCDSYISWSKKNKMTIGEVCEFMQKNGFIDQLKAGALLKLTGGEPFIQQKGLIDFCRYLRDNYGFVQPGSSALPRLRIDFETNGTLMPDQVWVDEFNATFTTSPKLKSNGDPEEKRYKKDVLNFLVRNGACFKFVVQSDKDVEEIYSKYINEPDILLPKSLVWLMPCAGSRDELVEVSETLAEICKKHSFKFSNRMHLQIWDKALKV